MLNTSKTKTRERCLIFICPALLKTEKNWKSGELFDFQDVVKDIPFEKMKSIAKTLNIDLNKKDYKEYQEGKDYEEMDNLVPFQSQWITTCKDFGGTKASAEVYRFILF